MGLRTTASDHAGDGRGGTVTKRAYHHGYYDRDEREFRGFGMVEAWDAEQFDATSETPLFSEVPTNGVGEVYAPPVYTVPPRPSPE